MQTGKRSLADGDYMAWGAGVTWQKAARRFLLFYPLKVEGVFLLNIKKFMRISQLK